jgi:RNA polymerase sigma-70 factor (ECF subfamily)
MSDDDHSSTQKSRDDRHESSGEAVEVLLLQIQKGHRESFAQLFAIYRPRLWRMITFRLHPLLQSRIDADDVLQDAWLRSYDRFDHFVTDGLESPFLWFRTIVNQTLVDLHRFHLGTRKRSAVREYSMNRGWSGDSTCSSLAYHLNKKQESPSSAVRRMEDAKQLDKALSGMNEVDREVLALRHFEELSNTETARILNMSEQAASARYVRALGRLKVVLEAFQNATSSAGAQAKSPRRKPGVE